VEYLLRRSRRARRVQLSVTAAEGLVVVAPPSVRRDLIEALIDERRAWIAQATARLAPERAFVLARAAEPLLPGEITLACLGERRIVDYLPRAPRPATVRERGPYRLSVQPSDDEAATCRALKRWLARTARTALVPWLVTLADDRGVGIGRVTVRSQRTRWASCAANGNISLNQNLLFLPRRLVRLVLVHELCHREEHNHSPRFWLLVAAAEPEHRYLEAELREAWKLVPRWAIEETHPRPQPVGALQSYET
jgi:predicted metal-dependent hydrolase